MYLFFNGVSSHGCIALVDSERNIVVSENFHISGNESTKTIPIIDDFLTHQKLNYSDIENIICVVGPGSFTGIRTISLVVNALAYIFPHIKLTPVNFFDLYDNYPIVKSSSKRDLFVKLSNSDIIELIGNADFEDQTPSLEVYGDTNSDRFEREIHISYEIDYSKVLKTLILQDNKTLAPLYIKKPNIS